MEEPPKQDQITRFKAPAAGLGPTWDLKITNFLFQHSSLTELPKNLIQAILQPEINPSITNPLQAFLKHLLSLHSPLKLENFPNQEDLMVKRWLLLFYGGQAVWNDFAKMVMKQVKLVDGAVVEGRDLKEFKGVIGWLMYYWDMLVEDMGFARLGGPELEGETGTREGVEVRISNFGRSEGLDMSYEGLFGEFKRITWNVEEVKEKMEGRDAVKDFAQQGEGTREEDTGTSSPQAQPQHAASSTHPSAFVTPGHQHNTDENLPRAGEKSADTQITEIPLPKEKVNTTQAPEEKADTEESQFYEAPEQRSDAGVEGSDDIPWAPKNERATIIPGLAHSNSSAEFLNQENDSMENIHNRFSEVIIDEVSIETKDHEISGETDDHWTDRSSSRIREQEGNGPVFQPTPAGGLFSVAPPPISNPTLRQQSPGGLFPAAPSPLPESSPRHPFHQVNTQSPRSRAPSSSQASSGQHGTQAQSSGDREREREREKKEREYQLALATVEQYKRAKAWEAERAKQKERERESQNRTPPQTTTPQSHPSTSSRHSDHVQQGQPRDSHTSEHRPSNMHELTHTHREHVQMTTLYQDPHAHPTQNPQQALVPREQPIQQEETVTPRAPKRSWGSWRTDRQGPNEPPPHNVRPRNSILKKRSEEEFSQMGRGKPQGPPTGREINFAASVKGHDGGRGSKAFEKPVKDPPVELYE